MPASFLHGAETIEISSGARPVRSVKTAVVGLVMTAPIHLLDVSERKVNELMLVASEADATKKVGPMITGFTGPQALDAIFDQGGASVLAVNVFDPSRHFETISQEAVSLNANGTAKLTRGRDSIITASVSSAASGTVYTAGSDYLLDNINGTLIQVEGGAIAKDEELHVTYNVPNLSLVTSNEIIGNYSSSNGGRTGMQAWKTAYNTFGFFPKILIAPGYSSLKSVALELEIIANEENCRAIALIDAPFGMSRDEVIAARGPDGSLNISSERVILCYPHVEVQTSEPNSNGETTRTEPLSQRFAGVIAATDQLQGYWYSPSNKQVKGVMRASEALSAMINNPQSDVNLLNEAGIVTLFNSFGSGLRTWGNRSSAWPASTAQMQFIQTRRTADMVHESLEYAMLQFIDLPMTDVLRDSLLETANGFIRELVSRGALVDGSRVGFDTNRNPESALAAGQMVFSLTLLPPPPAERITIESRIDITLLRALAA